LGYDEFSWFHDVITQNYSRPTFAFLPLKEIEMTTQDLSAKQAIDKIKELAESIDFALLCTDLTSQPFHAIPMSTKRVDDDGSIWFLSGQDSTHNINILRNLAVQLLYSDPKSMRFLIIYGQALILTEGPILKSLYKKSDDAWFDSVEDPNLSAIKVVPHSAHYWDIKGNKLAALWKMGVAAVTGSEADIVEHGDLKV